MAVSSSPKPSSKGTTSPQIKNQKKPKRTLAESEPQQPSSAPPQSRRKRTKSPGVRVVGGRIYDSENGKTCHQCRQKTMDTVAACKNITNEKPCNFKFCHKCLLNRYAEKAEEVDQLETWNCPKCRKICNCSFCMKKKGQQPTGILVHRAKAYGFQSVLEMLTGNGPRKAQEHSADGSDDSSPSKATDTKKHKRKRLEHSNTNDVAIGGGEKKVRIRHNKVKKMAGAMSEGSLQEGTEQNGAQSDRSTREHINSNDIVIDGDGKKPKIRKIKIKKLSQAKSDINLQGGSEDNGAQSDRNTEEPPVPVETCEVEKEKIIETSNIDNNKPKKSRIRKKRIGDPTNMQGDGGKDNLENKPKLINDFKHKSVHDADIPLPQGIDLTTVAGIELSSADVGPALQFLEFSNAFEEILELKKGEVQSVLQELTSGCKLPRRQYSSVILFHEKLLSLIHKDMGEEHLISQSSNGSFWFQALGKCISESQYALNKIPSECFDGDIDGYGALDTSKRLWLLNFLCDETLCTKNLRGWIDKQNQKLVKSRKEAKEKVLAAKDKEKQLKKQMQDEVAKEIILRNGAPLSVSEHKDLFSTIKSEAAKAQAEKLAAIEKHRSDAVRTEPVLSTGYGLTFWKLSGCSAEPNILLQDVGKCDSDESEKWFTYDVEQIKEVENYISHQRRKTLRSQVVRHSSIEGTDTAIKNELSDSPLPNESD